MDVICLGNLVFDRVYKVDSLFQGSGKKGTHELRERGGGAAATAALAVALQDVSTAFWGRLGDDDEGRWLTRRLEQVGINAQGVKRFPGRRTPSAAVLVDPRGERQIIVFNDPDLEMTPDWLELDAIKHARVVLTDLRWLAGAPPLLEEAARWHVPTVLDVDVVTPGPSIDAILALSTYAICSQQALQRLLPKYADPREALKKLAPQCGGVAAVTLGAEGSLWFIDGALHQVPAFRVTVKDSTGAGDVFHGVFASGIAQGLAPLVAARRASAASALLCEAGTGWDGIPDKSQVDAFLTHRADA